MRLGVSGFWLQPEAHVQEIERSLLEGGGRRDHVELSAGGAANNARTHAIESGRGELLEQRLEAVYADELLLTIS